MAAVTRKKKIKVSIGSVIGNVILWVCVLVVILPFVWVFLTSLKSNQDFYVNVWGLPKEWMWDNYARAWERGRIGSGVLNRRL
jgi:ABC-type glycerol-3-phosphate transport system permease component